MGLTTRISDYEWERGDGAKEIPEGYDVEEHHTTQTPSGVSTTKAKKVEPETKPAPKKSTAKTTTKDVKS